MPLPAPPRLPVPTGVGWLLLESLQQGAWLKKIAQIAAIGAKLLCKDEERAQAAFYKMLSKLRGGKQPRESTLTTFKEALRKGVWDLFQKSPAYMPELADCIAQRLDAATGPFAALAVGYVPLSPNNAQQRLFDFSNDLDQLGASSPRLRKKAIWLVRRICSCGQTGWMKPIGLSPTPGWKTRAITVKPCTRRRIGKSSGAPPRR